MLTLENVNVYYGGIHALRDVSLRVEAGEVVTLIGANGAGKSTTLRAVTGLLTPRSGRIRFEGADITGLPAHHLVGRGISMAPEGRGIFANLTVLENLEMGAYRVRNQAQVRSDIERGFSLFPRLRERVKQRSGTLSGGEQQMLAIARALMSRPKLLLLDEPSVGLSPLMVEKVLDTIVELARAQKLTVVIVEQRVTEVLEIAHTGHVLDHGRIVQADTAERLRNDRRIQQTYMGL
jgi:branched-chain amino acid transport system ATP-binding protein